MMRRAQRRWQANRLAWLLPIALTLVGCGRAAVREVNSVAIARRISYTDETSRRLARGTLDLAKERTTDYRVGPRDVLEISVFEWVLKNEAHTVAARVAESGIVSLPVIGELPVGGLAVQQVQSLVETRLREDGILHTPRVSVTVKDFRSKLVAVVGAVHEPGLYTLRTNATTLLGVLTLAGGVTEAAGQVLYIIRTEDPREPQEGAPTPAERQVIAVDLYELLELGILDLNAVLRDGDVVRVPRAAEFSVLGFVREPGRFALSRPVSVLEGIALAGGLQERQASPRSCVLKRRAHEGEEIIPLDLLAISRGTEPNLFLLPNDVIEVRQTAAKKFALETLDLIRGVFSVGYSLN